MQQLCGGNIFGLGGPVRVCKLRAWKLPAVVGSKRVLPLYRGKLLRCERPFRGVRRVRRRDVFLVGVIAVLELPLGELLRLFRANGRSLLGGQIFVGRGERVQLVLRG